MCVRVCVRERDCAGKGEKKGFENLMLAEFVYFTIWGGIGKKEKIIIAVLETIEGIVEEDQKDQKQVSSCLL